MIVTSDTGLSPQAIEGVTSVFSQYPQIDKAILYGSRASGTHRNGSDIDLTLTGSGLNFSVMTKIENDLDDLLLPYKIDLSVLDAIENEDLLEHIQRIGKVFYAKGC